MSGKKPKQPRKPKAAVRDGLEQQIKLSEETGTFRSQSKTRKKQKRRDDDEGERAIPEKLSKKILTEVQEQQKELDQEDFQDEEEQKGFRARTESIFGELKEDDEDDVEEPEEPETEMPDMQLSEADEKSLEMFMPQAQAARRTLADIIMDKIKEKEQVSAPRGSGAEAVKRKLDPKVAQVYQEVGHFMRHYRSGKIPKAFKIIPTLKNWEEILYITSPGAWSSQALSKATTLFASNLNAKMAQRFYNLVLLPAVRENIATYKALNYHLYQALIKSAFKPAAFFKGIILPIAEEGATAKEAIVLSSVLSKASIPVLHAAVALLKLAQMSYSGASALFMKTLLNKKYALPYRVLDALVKYFSAFSKDERKMPVVWHQNLLVFVQRFKNHLTTNQKTALRNLLRVQTHHVITPEIRRELAALNTMELTGSSAPPAGLGGDAPSMDISDL